MLTCPGRLARAFLCLQQQGKYEIQMSKMRLHKELLAAAVAAFLMGGCAGGSADLTGADFSRSVLTRANMDSAILRNASLVGVDLRGANLTSAILIGTDLTGARLDGANLSGSQLGGATWTDGHVCAINSVGFCL